MLPSEVANLVIIEIRSPKSILKRGKEFKLYSFKVYAYL